MIIEKYVQEFLTAAFSNELSVYLEEPENKPESYITIEKTGSSVEEKFINEATLAIKSYAASLYKASLINEQLKEIMINDLAAEPEIIRIELNSDYNFTDTTIKRYRYQAVFNIFYY